MRILLITGGAGFIGSNFVRYWLAQHPTDTVIVLDKLTYAGNTDNLSGLESLKNYHFIQGDINNKVLLNELFSQFEINTVVNFAAETHVDNSILSSDEFMQANVMGTHALLSVAKQHWLDGDRVKEHRFHHISTDEVFGTLSPDEPAFTESHLYQPNSPYAASKAGADHIVRAFHATYGLDISISHCSNNYGPYHFPEKLIPLALINLLTGKKIPVYGDGLQMRDWLHVVDHCRAIDAILHSGEVGESYNVGGHDGEMTNLALIDTLCAALDKWFAANPEYEERFPLAPPAQGRSCREMIEHVTDRLGHDRRYAINSSKIKHRLDFEYSISVKEGLQQTVHWYLENEAWWRALIEPAILETS